MRADPTLAPIGSRIINKYNKNGLKAFKGIRAYMDQIMALKLFQRSTRTKYTGVLVNRVHRLHNDLIGCNDIRGENGNGEAERDFKKQGESRDCLASCTQMTWFVW